jgi:xanthine dehydrogenase FAD-binding subunit
MSGNHIKFSNRNAMDILILGVVVICNSNNGIFNDLRISLGVAAPTPIRCSEAENFAKNKLITEENIKETGRLAVKSSKSRDSWRGSKSHREHLIEVLAQREIKEAIKRVERLE